MKNVTKKTIILSLVLGSMMRMQTVQCLPSMSSMASSAASVAKENKWLLMSAAVAACGVAGLYAYFKLWQQDNRAVEKQKHALRTEQYKQRAQNIRDQKANQKYILELKSNGAYSTPSYEEESVANATCITKEQLTSEGFEPKAACYRLISKEKAPMDEAYSFGENIHEIVAQLKKIVKREKIRLKVVISSKDMLIVNKKKI